MSEPPTSPPSASGGRRGRGCGTWAFVVVPALVVGLLVLVVALAARPDGDDTPRLSGPAAELPAVIEATTTLLGADPGRDGRADALGERIGTIGRALAEENDETAFVAEFDRFPPDEAKLIGRLLGSIQRELSPSSVGGPRAGDERAADTQFALQLVMAAAPELEPGADAETHARNVLPAVISSIDEGDEIVAAVAASDVATAAELLEPVLSEAGAAEIVSGLAGDISDRVGERNDRVRLREFQTAYNLQIP